MREKRNKRRKEIGTNSDDGGGGNGEPLQENREESSHQSKLSVLRLLSEQVSYSTAVQAYPFTVTPSGISIKVPL